MSEKEKARWSTNLRKIFIDILIEFISKNGRTTDGTFKSADWTTITNNFNRVSGKNYLKNQLQGQFAELKKKFIAFEKLKGFSGMCL